MNSLEEARQDKLNAQIEFTTAKEEFKMWKEMNGIKPKDEIYIELKQAVLTANDNFNKARDIYNRLMTSKGEMKPSVMLPERNVPSNTVSSLPATNSQVVAEEVTCSSFSAGPPVVSQNRNRDLIFRIHIKAIIGFFCIMSVLGNVNSMIMGPGFGLIFLILNLMLSSVITSTNLGYISICGWVKLLCTIIELIVTFTAPRYYYGPPQIIDPIFQVIFGYGYLFGLQQYYYALQKKEDEQSATQV